ncbi:hypothetical protein BgiBS90_014760 [Biomphalaria glabrata]|nr:hypothetical protein BgiBS90_014760 [Biomphalaria glabrata]
MISRSKTSRRQNGSRQNVPSPKRRGQNGVAKTAAPKRRRQNVTYRIRIINTFRDRQVVTGYSTMYRKQRPFIVEGLNTDQQQ